MSRYRGIKLRLDAGIGLVYAEPSLDHRRINQHYSFNSPPSKTKHYYTELVVGPPLSFVATEITISLRDNRPIIIPSRIAER